MYSQIENVVRPSMGKALAYANAERGRNGFEEHWRHYYDLNIVNYSLPFHRTVDGQDHTHFILDIDVHPLNVNIEKQYQKYPEQLRILKLGAVLSFFKGWYEDRCQNHNFLWSISGTGIHAIQRINKRVNRQALLPFVVNKLFPRCSKQIDKENNYEIPEYRKFHKCKPECLGWHYEYKIGSNNDYNIKSKIMVKQDEFYVKLIKYKGITFKLILDLNFFLYDKKIIRWVYSPYFNIPSRIFFSIPIKNWDLDWVLRHSVTEGIEIEPFQIPPFDFQDEVDFEEVDEIDWQEQKTPHIKSEKGYSRSTKYTEIQLFDVDTVLPPSYNRILDRMTREFENPECSPCIRAHYLKARFEHGAHWSRMPIVRYLAHKGYNIHQIANWIRFRLNQPYHNLPQNRGKLLQFLPVTIQNPDNPDPVPRCAVMQNPGHNFFICSEKMQLECGRTYALQTKKLNKNRKGFDLTKAREQLGSDKVKKNDEHVWNNIVEKLDYVLDQPDDFILWKSTRAGVTTTMIYSAFRRGIKLLVLVPTNKIAYDTFKKALNITYKKTGRYIAGGVLAKNDISCLELQLKAKKLKAKKNNNPTWGDDDLAWSKLLFRAKPSCTKCKFRNATVEIPLVNSRTDEILPVFSSYDSNPKDINARTGWCAYQTIRQNITEFNVLFMTYAKMQTLRQSKEVENRNLFNIIMSEYQIVFLDEISTESQSSPLVLDVLKHHKQPQDFTTILDYDLFQKLRYEILQLQNYSQSNVAMEIENVITKFIHRFEGIKLREWQFENVITNNSYDIVSDHPKNPMFQHPLTSLEREELRLKFTIYHNILENYARIYNKGLFYIEKVMMLLIHDYFFGNNLPTHSNNFLEYKFIVSPSILELRGFIHSYKQENPHVKIITTDAMLPTANVSDLLNIPFKDYVIGDPRGTNKKQLIMADTFNVFPNDLLKAGHCIHERCPFWSTEKNDCNNFLQYKFWKHGKTIQRKIYARVMNGDKCLKLQIKLIKDIKHLMKSYGAENIFLVFSSTNIKRWFVKFWLRKLGADYGKLKYSYYRSDLTVGVECDRRIMITVGSPMPPKNSHLWLAYYYHQYGLLRNYGLTNLSEVLQKNNMQSAYWQTVGRAKDPESKVRSIVFSWGLSQHTLNDLMNFHAIMRDSLPYHIIFDSQKYNLILMLEILFTWRRHGVIVYPLLINFIDTILKMNRTDMWLSQRDIYNDLSIDYSSIRGIIATYTISDLEKFGLYIRSRTWGSKKIYSFYFASSKYPLLN